MISAHVGSRRLTPTQPSTAARCRTSKVQAAPLHMIYLVLLDTLFDDPNRSRDTCSGGEIQPGSGGEKQVLPYLVYRSLATSLFWASRARTAARPLCGRTARTTPRSDCLLWRLRTRAGRTRGEMEVHRQRQTARLPSPCKAVI